MAISEVCDAHMVQRCAGCAASNQIAFAELQAGFQGPSGHAPEIVSLPACACGTTEFLISTHGKAEKTPATGSIGHLHRLLVDHLHDELLVRGQVAGDGDHAPTSVDRKVSADELREWFPNGLKLDVPSAEESR